MDTHPPAGQPAQVGRIGRYRLDERIGSGSFATVYKGRDDELDVPVAVKLLNPDWAANDEVRRRFVSEARYLRRIRDERVIRVYDIGTTPDQRPFFVMDYADGGSFESLRRQPVAPGRALRLCAEAARALEVLHRHHVLHRDVTPGNILLHHSSSGLRVLLADLGVAETMADAQRQLTTAGTPAFMAPEQAAGRPLDQRADVYSMAAVTFALLTGRPPFATRSVSDLLSRDPQVGPPLIAHQLGAPAALDTLMTDALSPFPERRPDTAEILATALDGIAALLPGGDSFVPRPLSTGFTPTSGFGSMGGTSDWGHDTTAPHGAAPASPPVAPRNETPISMLENYLGKGRYQPAKARERHSLGFWVSAVAGATALLGLVIVLTVIWLTR